MDSLDNSKNISTSGGMDALLLEDLQIEGQDKANQCGFPESDPLNNF